MHKISLKTIHCSRNVAISNKNHARKKLNLMHSMIFYIHSPADKKMEAPLLAFANFIEKHPRALMIIDGRKTSYDIHGLITSLSLERNVMLLCSEGREPEYKEAADVCFEISSERKSIKEITYEFEKITEGKEYV